MHLSRRSFIQRSAVFTGAALGLGHSRNARARTQPLDEAQMLPIRQHANLLLRGNAAIGVPGYLPCDGELGESGRPIGDKHFAHIAKDYGGGGTTCGFLCHWLLWRLGCSNASIVNREEPASGFKYADGMNIAKIWNIGRLPFVNILGKKWVGLISPALGDIVFISGPRFENEHVFVFLDQTYENGIITWSTAESGQGLSKSVRSHKGEIIFKKRVLRPTHGGGAMLSGNSPERYVNGWLSLALLDYNSMPPIPPVLPFPADPYL